ncbi:MAG: HXXEE domain-containing protein [Candidatus Thorarchaeota archaeon]
MGDIADYGLYFISLIGVALGIYIAFYWQTMPVLQIMSCLFYIGLVLHEWEEIRYPGGFLEMMGDRMGVTAPRSAHVIAYCLIIVLALVPVFFPTIIWLVLAPMFLGLIEALMHFVGIKIMKREKFYTPGLVTAWVFLLPVSLYTIYFVLANNLAVSLDWLFGLAYFIVSFGVMEVLIRRMTQ